MEKSGGGTESGRVRKWSEEDVVGEGVRVGSLGVRWRQLNVE